MLKPFDSKTYQRNAKKCGGDECCLCGKPTAGLAGAIHVPVNHETGQFVTKAQAEAMGDKVSLYPIGPSCVKKWSREFDAESCRFRRSKGRVISYDHQATR